MTPPPTVGQIELRVLPKTPPGLLKWELPIAWTGCFLVHTADPPHNNVKRYVLGEMLRGPKPPYVIVLQLSPTNTLLQNQLSNHSLHERE